MSEEKKKKVIEVNHLDEKKKSSMINRLIVAGILIVLCVPALFFGGWAWFAVITVALLCATYEAIHAPRKKYKWYVYVFTYVIVLCLVYWMFIKSNLAAFKSLDDKSTFVWELENNLKSISFSVILLAAAIGGYCLFALLDPNFNWNDVTYLFTMCVLLGIGFQSLLYVRYYPVAYNEAFYSWQSWIDKSSPGFKYAQSVLFIIFILLGVIMNDVWAYFVGMFFGKHKMSPRVSPNKTWEGFFGGWILGGLTALGFVLIVDACGMMILPPYQVFTVSSQWWWIVILSFFIPLIGDLGDLTMSMVKRHYGIKDFSHLLGAHGGMLDRVDSMLFVFTFAAIFTTFVSNGWNILL